MSLDSNSGTVDKEHRFDDKSRHQCALSEHMQAHRFVHVCVWAHLCVHTHVVHIRHTLKELSCCLRLEHLRIICYLCTSFTEIWLTLIGLGTGGACTSTRAGGQLATPSPCVSVS